MKLIMARKSLAVVIISIFTLTEAIKPPKPNIPSNWKQPTCESELKENRALFYITWPGTLWCGPGDKADDYDHLATGAGRPADICCRDHDHCHDNISAFETKYGLFNWRPFTLSHCDCDNKFLNCMTNNQDLISTNIAHLYFNLINVPCFRENGKLFYNKFTPTKKVWRDERRR